MAITWTPRITPIGNNNYSVSATVTDDTKPADHQTEMVGVISCRLDTQEQKDGVWAELKKQYSEKVNKTDDIAAIEAEAKAALEKV